MRLGKEGKAIYIQTWCLTTHMTACCVLSFSSVWLHPTEMEDTKNTETLPFNLFRFCFPPFDGRFILRNSLTQATAKHSWIMGVDQWIHAPKGHAGQIRWRHKLNGRIQRVWCVCGLLTLPFLSTLFFDLYTLILKTGLFWSHEYRNTSGVLKQHLMCICPFCFMLFCTCFIMYHICRSTFSPVKVSWGWKKKKHCLETKRQKKAKVKLILFCYCAMVVYYS